MRYRRNQEGPAPELSETYEPETVNPIRYPTPEGWWGPPYRAPTPAPTPEELAWKDAYVAIATGAVVLLVGGGFYLAHRFQRRRRWSARR